MISYEDRRFYARHTVYCRSLGWRGYALSESLKGAKLIYDREYTWIFHSSGLEPWVCGLLRRLKPVSVLDVGCGLGYWGLILKVI